MARILSWAAWALIGCSVLGSRVLGAPPDEGTPSPDQVDFVRDIQPLLKQHCEACHAGQNQEGGIRWDRKSSVLGGGDSGTPAVVPGDPEQSLLIQLVRGDDPDYVMPPVGEGRAVSAEGVALLIRWIQQGAPWPESASAGDTNLSHWAWKRPVKVPPPEVKHKEWPHNLIDDFVLARLESEALSPSPEANRYALVRRLYLDLIGIPPTPQQADEFVGDTRPEAYERLVDDLLASPHYGERWALMWLDLARYADTQGYEKDLKRTIWPYRDWVINALNRDLPFDQFTIDQIAGDLLPNPTSEQLVATAFHRNTMTNTEGGTDNEEFRTAAVIDRVATTGQVWMGLTLGCAQCHSHKYDPVTQREFYEVYAFFNQTADNDSDDERPTYRVPPPEIEEQLRSTRAALRQQHSRLDTTTPELAAGQAKWESRIRKNGFPPPAVLNPWHTVGPLVAADFNAAHDTAFGPEQHTPPELGRSYTADQLQWQLQPAWKDATVHPLEGQNSAHYLYRTIALDTPRPFEFLLGSDDSVKVWMNGKLLLDRRVSRAVAPDQERLLAMLESGENHLLMKIVNGSGPSGFYFRAIDKTSSPEIARLLEQPVEDLGVAERETLARHYRSIAPELQSVREDVQRLEIRLASLQTQATGPATPVMQELPREAQRETHLLVRGSFLNPGPSVAPGVPAGFHPLPGDAPLNRLGLAQWLVDRANPLTARVTVNRFWETFFGSGLVRSSEDFGTQGELPSHPELLDTLAIDFMDQGWSMKKLCKRIVMSATYQQSSRASAALLASDPDNRLLSRGPRYRLAAELVRDQTLAISGLLSRKMHGPSVMPVQPEGVWSVVYNAERWETSPGEDRYRRGLYTFWRRTSPYPSMLALDATSREVCTVRRVLTNTPLAALVTLNDPVFVEAAQALALDVLALDLLAPDLLAQGRDVASRVDYAVRRCLIRPSTEDERQRLASLVDDQLRHYRNNSEAARQMAGERYASGDYPFDVAEVAAWTVVCNVLLNLDEFLSKG